MGWLDAQGYGGAGACFAETATALSRRRELDGAAAVATGKTEEEEKRRRRRLGSNNTAQKLKEAALWPSPRQRDAKDGHDRAWKQTEDRRPCSFGGGHCSSKLQNCHSPKFPNYSQIFITTQKSPKTKVVQNLKFYNFAFYNQPLIQSTF